jgi:hypothetical protein
MAGNRKVPSNGIIQLEIPSPQENREKDTGGK